MKIEIQFLDFEPLSRDKINTLRSSLKRAFEILKIPERGFTIVFTSDAKIREYNRFFLNRDYPTNVLAFKSDDRSKYLGEIIISVERAEEESKVYNLSFEAYLLALTVHGLLHLLGYDHERGLYSPWLMLKNEIDLIRGIFPDEELIKFLQRREFMPAKLAVNVDHVATVREARKTYYPDPVHAAVLAELGGADGIVVHLRLDRRHINERDVKIIREITKTKLILEMANTPELIKFAKEIRPYQVTLVPERVEEITTEGGLELEGRVEEIKKAVKELNRVGIKVSLFLNPEEKVLELAKKTGAQIVELHTGKYAEAKGEEEVIEELARLERASHLARDLGFIVHAGHGLNYENIGPVAAIPEVEEFSIGHSIIGRSIMVGMKEAVREMKELILRARG
ncbi:MAG: pyridoxine 5'-phosphate synthase [Caldimicrobium sp.]|nr:pyridoxine 5'-phosphate synthase [Caldimicrobium sp.]MCX7612667.1 pyridoxine 5'-phosphate synthase [Caldimicrobium sp.]MDW8182180.1 pyridoxine 5'-phosphate synthase [Caldimicrobium sp.]